MLVGFRTTSRFYVTGISHKAIHLFVCARMLHAPDLNLSGR